jgi:hypothetical protein
LEGRANISELFICGARALVAVPMAATALTIFDAFAERNTA